MTWLPLAFAAAVLAPRPPGAEPEWRAPVTGEVEVVRPFQAPVTPYGPGHRGVDLAAAPGEPVLAAGAGRVGFAGPVAGRGVVVVAHRGGLRSTYQPVTAAVRVGAVVPAGAVLGVLAPGTRSDGLSGGHCGLRGCLHWGVRRGHGYLDPMTLLAADGPDDIVLLPARRPPRRPPGPPVAPAGPRPVDEQVSDAGWSDAGWSGAGSSEARRSGTPAVATTVGAGLLAAGALSLFRRRAGSAG